MTLSLGPIASVVATIADFAAAVGVIVALVTLIIEVRRVRRDVRVNRASFWLDLETMFRDHDTVHSNLKRGGSWSDEKGGPENEKEWGLTEDYLGLFEICEILLENELIDWETFHAIYAPRLPRIVGNTAIINRVKSERERWKYFFALLDRANITIQ